MSGDFYMRIVNGWSNSSNVFYNPGNGATWISATSYWVGD